MKVSIIIPVYDKIEYLQETLDSLSSQSFKDFEAIIVSDGSSFDLEPYKNEYTRIYYREHEGVAAARNYGIEHANGEYLLFLDSDDYISRNFLEVCVSILDADKEVSCVRPICCNFGEKQGIAWAPWEGYKHELVSNVLFITSMIRTADAKRIDGFDNELIDFEDWDFFIKLLYHNDKVVDTQDAKFYYRHLKKSRSTCSVNDFWEFKKQLYTKHKNKYKEYGIL